MNIETASIEKTNKLNINVLNIAYLKGFLNSKGMIKNKKKINSVLFRKIRSKIIAARNLKLLPYILCRRDYSFNFLFENAQK